MTISVQYTLLTLALSAVANARDSYRLQTSVTSAVRSVRTYRFVRAVPVRRESWLNVLHSLEGDAL
jgi:hypothetical protein